MSGDFTAFLSARLDEDQAAATASAESDWWGAHAAEFASAELYNELGDLSVEHWEWWPADADFAHIARHDPARVLREVEAKRARLALYEQAQAKLDHILAHPGEMSAGDEGLWLGKVAAARMACRHDAAVYRDHPGYREDWAPAAVIMR